MKIGVMGAGTISSVYLRFLTAHAETEVVAVADRIPERAAQRAQEFGVPKVLSPDALLADPDIEVVCNLTVPAAHYAVSRDALAAGKHVYSEKPLALTYAEGQDLVARAARSHLGLAVAPDTVLGSGLQTARGIVDSGAMGRIVGGTLAFMNHGHESWHPDPAFYYQEGGGPVFDMAPYYLTALVSLLGPVAEVRAQARTTWSERTVTSPERRGQRIPVRTPTHIAGVLTMAQGAVVSVTFSFDVWHHQLPWGEIYGSGGTLWIPDPNTFGGPVRWAGPEQSEPQAVPMGPGPVTESRGLGLLDLVHALAEDRPPRLDGQLGLHVLEVMEALLIAGTTGGAQTLRSTANRPDPLLAGPGI